jgi:hypothetical protein
VPEHRTEVLHGEGSSNLAVRACRQPASIGIPLPVHAAGEEAPLLSFNGHPLSQLLNGAAASEARMPLARRRSASVDAGRCWPWCCWRVRLGVGGRRVVQPL